MLKKLHLAVFFEHELTIGGNHQQSLNVVNLASTISDDVASIIFITTSTANQEILKSYGISALVYAPSFFSTFLLKLRSVLPFTLLKLVTKFSKNNNLERFLVAYKVDLVYFTSQSVLAEYLENTNYIYTLFDLCHRDHPVFPEVRAGRSFEKRDLHFKKVLTKAVAVFVDSELGKSNAITRYALEQNRVHVLSFSPSFDIASEKNSLVKNTIDIKREYGIEMDYIFYPAQFWAHKNHVYILQGLKLLEERFGIKLSVIFSGGDQGNMTYIKRTSLELNLNDRVKFVGFVTNEQIRQLYQQSVALVMPSYFGPTNLPPLEAFCLGIPVLYSDLPGLRDQVEGAALLLDLADPFSLARQLSMLLSDENLRKSLVLKGFKRLAEVDNNDVRVETLNAILGDFYRCRICWE